MKSRSLAVVVYKEDDMYIAECPEIGTVDQGETIEQAIFGLREATRLYLEEFSGASQLCNRIIFHQISSHPLPTPYTLHPTPRL